MRPAELQSNAVGSSTLALNGVGVLAMCLMAAAFSQGCGRPSCAELHDPGCWIPPVFDAGVDADAGDGEGEVDAGDGGGEEGQAAGDAQAGDGSMTGD
jgi:hypothetical protein